jgi:hypothetical protein
LVSNLSSVESAQKGVTTVLAVKDISKLLADVPKGAWVALSKDEERVVAYAAELPEAIQKAKEAGEHDPVVIRVPEAGGPTLLF